MAQTPQYGSERSTSDLKEKATDTFGRVADKAKEAVDQVEGFAGKAMDQGREAGERIQEVAGNGKGAVDKSIKDNP